MCIPLSAEGRGVNLLPNFQKRGLERTSIHKQGVAGKEGGDLFQEGSSFYIKGLDSLHV